MNKPDQAKRNVAAKRFEWAVRSLAQPAHVQMQLFPNFVCKADELALEFDEWHRTYFASGASENLSPGQMRFISDLDSQLSSMSGEENGELWTDGALANRWEWTRVRDTAMALINEMEWNTAPPPIDRGDKFVGGENESGHV